MARLLGLHDTATPWHVARDGVAEFGWLCSLLTATCARLARNIVDLSRTEIAEVFEPYSDHRGASSTMPQKVNPITSESIIGLSGTAALSPPRCSAPRKQAMSAPPENGTPNGASCPNSP
ncbi:lyase family protein [Streptomyces indonesiensis]